jgi:ATP phosphoribosyltransferase regulatory subunit
LWQLGAEILGVEGEAAEHEALERFLGLLALAGVAAPRIVVSVAGALDRVLQQGRTRVEALELAAAVERRDRSMVRAVPALLGVVETGLPSDLGSLGDDRLAARLEHLESWCRDLEKGHPGLMVRLDLAEFAGQTIDPELAGTGGARSYYDGLVFRAFAGRGFLPVGSGGRYDSLYQRLGAATTAVGFSIGLDRLVEVLEEEPPRAATSALGRPTEALGRPAEVAR